MSDDPLDVDPNWSAVARFLDGRITPGQRVTGLSAFVRITGPLATPHPAVLPDWAIVHRGSSAPLAATSWTPRTDAGPEHAALLLVVATQA